jgi:putative glutamine amidotransferase
MAMIEQSSATGVSFALTDEQRELRALARAFAEKEIRPKAAEYDEHSAHPADVIAKAHELGLMNLHVPEEYGGNRVTEMTQLDRALDQTEAALVRGAVDSGVPVLGICRGQQLINVALGGSLLQHIDGHDGHGQPRSLLAHVVAIDPDSELGRVAPQELMVNSLHHQAVKDLAPGLRATAHSPDGIVEGLESADGMVVAVQSHPEELITDEPWARALFAQFVERSAGRARRPAPQAGGRG